MIYQALGLGLTLGLTSALIACVYSVILTEPEMLLNGWFNWLDKRLGLASRVKLQGPNMQGVSPEYTKPRAYWLFKLLVGCPRCVAGQAGTWFYLLVVLTAGAQYFWLGHILSAAMSIFAVSLLHKLYKWSRS
jgi:hypothetical protein